MARALVTEEAVAEVAQQLVEAGEEPSIIRIQALIGGGSFSTVKKHLDAWKARRQAASPAIEAPPLIADRASEFGRQLWQEAVSLASRETARVREEAQRQIDEARAATAEAEQIIARLEAELEEQGRRLEQALREHAEATALVQQAQTAAQVAEARRAEQAARLADLQRQTETQAAELAQARAELIAQARLAGEIEALRRQLGEQQPSRTPRRIKKPSDRRGDPG